MEVVTEVVTLHLEEPFVIARGRSEVARNVLVRIRYRNYEGIGEVAPSSFYNQSVEKVLETVPQIARCLPDTPSAVRHIFRDLSERFSDAASLCATDIALWDLHAKTLNAPLYRVLGLDPQRTPQTSYTLSIAEPHKVAQRAKKVSHYPILKIKLGTKAQLGEDLDVEVIQALREVYGGTVRVDANCAWTVDEAIDKIYALQAYDIEFYEQPIPPGDPDDFARLKKGAPDAVIVADESCVKPQDVVRLAPVVDGVNIKLVKCGGITPALQMIETARACGLRVMLGCMIESSCLITAAATLSPLVDWADLDGNLLVADDPFVGVTLDENAQLILPDRPGLGLVPRKNQPSCHR